MAIFAGGKLFRLQRECVEFSVNKIAECQFTWFIDIVGYLQFLMGETVSPAEPQKYEAHTVKVINKK